MEVCVEDLLNQREEKQKKRRTRATTIQAEKPKSVRKLTKKEREILDLANNTVLPDHYKTVWTEQDLDELCEWLASQKVVAIDTETMGVNPFTDDIVGISFYAPHQGYYIPLQHIEHVDEVPTEAVDEYGNKLEELVIGVHYVKCLPRQLVRERLKPLLEDEEKKWIGHNIKFDCHVLHNWMGIDIKPFFDTMVAQALLDENQSKALKDMAPLYLGVPADKFSTLFGKVTFDKVPIRINPETRTGNLATYYAVKDPELTYRMAEFQARAFNRPGLEQIKSLFYDVEMPFLEIVTEAERHGIKLDEEYLLNEVAVKLRADVEELRQKIWAYTGEINLQSPAQLAEALYEKLGLPRLNPDKPNSTDKRTLKKLKKHHVVIGLLMEFKEKVKLANDFAEKLPKMAVNGRVHPSFNTVGARTGRTSCNSPNLQQIPAKVGSLIRSAFVADEGRLLASIDFSGQELRWLAHVTQDPVLLSLFREGKDVHSKTAVGMWNDKHPDQQVTFEYFEYCRGMTSLFQDADGNLVEEKLKDIEYITKLHSEGKINTTDPLQLRVEAELGIKFEKIRKDAKVVNFGIIYGMGEHKLADTLEITVEEAQSYINAYFAQYPRVKAWMDEQRRKMDTVHYTTTYLGRKRRVYQEMQSGRFGLIQRGYRQGINAVIQGSSADQTKLASIKLQPLLKELDARILLWIHDELIIDVPENIGMENLRRIADVMCNAIQLDCGMKSDIEVGKKWSQKMSEDDINALREMYNDDSSDDEGEEE